MIFLYLYGLMIIFALIHIAASRTPRTLHRVMELFLLYLLIGIGISGILAYIAHVFYAANTAAYIGWPAGSPFQYEVGVANLGLGILGILCIWARRNFWLATIIINGAFAWGIAYGHVAQMIKLLNYNPGNAGIVFWIDLLIPLITFVLFIIYRISGIKAGK